MEHHENEDMYCVLFFYCCCGRVLHRCSNSVKGIIPQVSVDFPQVWG